MKIERATAKQAPSQPLHGMSDNIRPHGSVEVRCACDWSFWVDANDPRLPAGLFICDSCSGAVVTAKADDLKTRFWARFGAMTTDEQEVALRRLFSFKG